jgi:hypothetical protein
MSYDRSVMIGVSDVLSLDLMVAVPRQGVVETFGFVYGAYFVLSLLFSRGIARLQRRGVLHPVHQIIIGCFFLQVSGHVLPIRCSATAA